MPESKIDEWLILLNQAIEELLTDNYDNFPIYLKKAILQAPSSELELIEPPKKLKFGKYKELFNFLQFPTVISKQNFMEIKETEVRLGIKIPDSVKEWYSIFGSREILYRFSGDKCLELYKLKVDRKIVEFLRNGDQYCFGFGFLVTEDKDPSIYYWNEHSECNDIGEYVWKKTREKFSDFIHNWIVNSFFIVISHSLRIYSNKRMIFHNEKTKISFIKCIKKDFIQIKTDVTGGFGSDSMVETFGSPDDREYFYNTTLDIYIHVYDSKQGLCFYKSDTNFKIFLNQLSTCINISQNLIFK